MIELEAERQQGPDEITLDLKECTQALKELQQDPTLMSNVASSGSDLDPDYLSTLQTDQVTNVTFLAKDRLSNGYYYAAIGAVVVGVAGLVYYRNYRKNKWRGFEIGIWLN